MTDQKVLSVVQNVLTRTLKLEGSSETSGLAASAASEICQALGQALGITVDPSAVSLMTGKELAAAVASTKLPSHTRFKPENKDSFPTVQKVEFVNNSSQTFYPWMYMYDANWVEGFHGGIGAPIVPGKSATIDLQPIAVNNDPVFLIPLAYVSQSVMAADVYPSFYLVYAANGQQTTVVVTDGPPQPQVSLKTSS